MEEKHAFPGAFSRSFRVKWSTNVSNMYVIVLWPHSSEMSARFPCLWRMNTTVSLFPIIKLDGTWTHHTRSFLRIAQWSAWRLVWISPTYFKRLHLAPLSWRLKCSCLKSRQVTCVFTHYWSAGLHQLRSAIGGIGVGAVYFNSSLSLL